MKTLRWLQQRSIWAPRAISAEHWRFRNQFRIVFPYVDAVFIGFGVVGWAVGVESVENAAGNAWQTNWSALVAISAFLALVGISFPKLWAIELLGKIPLIGLVCGYLALFFVRGFDGEPKVVATAVLLTALVAFPIWRVGDIAITFARPAFLAWKQRRADRRSDASEAER